MENQIESLSYVDPIYCSDDFFQIMLGYKNFLILFNSDGCSYYRNFGKSGLKYINCYLEDDRKDTFPYSNIPEHVEMNGFFSKCHITNQVLEFEKTYLCFFDGCVEELVGYKEDNRVLIYNKFLWNDFLTRKRRFVTKSELASYLQNGSDEEKNKCVEMIREDGYFYPRKIQSDEEILEDEREYLLRNLGYQYNLNSRFGKELQKAILSMDKIEPYHWYPFYLLTINEDGEIHIEFASVTFHDWDLYELDTVELPVTKESLNIVKNRIQSPIKRLSVNPKIPLILNPNVTREQIKDAQQKVLRLSRNS